MILERMCAFYKSQWFARDKTRLGFQYAPLGYDLAVGRDHLDSANLVSFQVSRYLQKYKSEDGKKQIPEIINRGFNKHFYFNPQPLMNM